MHSDLEQAERDKTMQQFKARQIDVLVATDIVARGIDIDDIKLVVNIDTPHDAEDYIHRIGRAGRAGREGRAVTLVSEKDLQRLQKIEALLEQKILQLDLPEGFEKPELKPLNPVGRGRKQSTPGACGGRNSGAKQKTGRHRGGKRRGGKQKEKSAEAVQN
jgi:superfamily II DNA/RNA helicase